MPKSIDCSLCLLRQSLEAARLASCDEAIHQRVVFEAMRLVLDASAETPPPVIGRAIHRLIKKITQNEDPYRAEKDHANAMMLGQFASMTQRVKTADSPLEVAVRLAIAGNSIDCALGIVRQEVIDRAFDEAIHQPINGSMEALESAIRDADSILYIADNAGEIVCDRLLIERLTETYEKNVTLAVRGEPILNDATLADAQTAGLVGLPGVTVLDNGNDGLGTFLDECSAEFLRHFTTSGLVIAKGLANFETLLENDTPYQPKKIAFLFKAKCPFISHFAGTNLGDLVVRLKSLK